VATVALVFLQNSFILFSVLKTKLSSPKGKNKKDCWGNEGRQRKCLCFEYYVFNRENPKVKRGA